VSTRVVSIGAHPGRIMDHNNAAGIIAGHLDMSASEIMKKLDTNKPFVWIDRDSAPDKAREIREQIGPGIALFDNYSRVYPNKTLAAQVLGFSGIDGNGLEGLEYYYEHELNGDVRESTFIRDALGRIFQSTEAHPEMTGGRNLVVTLDRNIQYIAEEALKKNVLRFNADSGMAVVMSPSTGAIKAVAHYPTFNPNAFGLFPRQTWRNRAVSDAFEPGSAMKVFLAAAAIESGLCDASTTVDCENGAYAVGGHTIKDIHPHDELTLGEMVKYSSNIGAVKIAEILGPENLYNTLCSFGFGEKTGIDCPGETDGRLRHYRNWKGIDNATIAFGQGVSVSAIQLLSAISAIANNGVLMKPHFVTALTDSNGRIIQSFNPEVRRRAISAQTASQVKNFMREVAEPDGTGVLAAPDGYSVCGKTGTAQILNSEGTYENCEYNSVFVGFAPARSPELAVVVVIEAPRVNHYGGVVAAPVFAEIIGESFNYMNIAPDLDKTGGHDGKKEKA